MCDSKHQLFKLPVTVVLNDNDTGGEYLSVWFEKEIEFPFLPRIGDVLQLNGFLDEVTVDFLEWSENSGFRLEARFRNDLNLQYLTTLKDNLELNGWKTTNFDGEDDKASIFDWPSCLERTRKNENLNCG